MRVGPAPPAGTSNANAGHVETHRTKTHHANTANTKAVVVKRGDTLIGIARRYGIPIKDLYRANPRFDPQRQDGSGEADRGRQGAWDPDYLRIRDRVRVPFHGPHAGPHGPQPPKGQSAGVGASPTPALVPPPGAAPQSPAGPLIAVAPRSQRLRGGIGVEIAGKGSAEPTLGGEVYFKGSVALGRHWNLNGKIKFTPHRKLLGGAQPAAGSGRALDPEASLQSRAPKRGRFQSVWREEVTVDGALAFDGKIEAGGSLEIDCDNRSATPFAYASKKDPNNVLLDRARLKLGKVNPRTVASAIVTGTRESVAQPRAQAKVNGRWTPLREQVWTAVKGSEIGIAGESGFPHHSPVSGLVNLAGKSTLGDIGAGLEPTAAAGATRFAGFITGTAASFVGAGVTDALVGKDIHNQTLRRAVDGFGGAMTGVVTDAVTQKAIPVVARRAAPVVSKLVTTLPAKAARLLGAAAPAVSKVAGKVVQIAAKIPLGATGRVLGKVVRIGGPAGALPAGIPDAIGAVKAFKSGRTADGWRAVGRGVVRVGCTAVGALAGQVLLPFMPVVGGALGAVAGGIVGDWVAKWF